MNPEDRMRVMEACLVIPGSGWAAHFTLMMAMSVIVAVMGLSANSAALVIGAMLIAPLMTPVLGCIDCYGPGRRHGANSRHR